MEKEELTQELVKLDEGSRAAKVLRRCVEIILEMRTSEAGAKALLTEVIKDDKLVVTDKRVSKSTGDEVLVEWRLGTSRIYWSKRPVGSRPLKSESIPYIKLNDEEQFFVKLLTSYLLEIKVDWVLDDLGL